DLDTMGLGLLSIYLNLKWKQNDFLKHILIISEMVKCKLPGDMVTQTARAARTFFFGAPKTHFDAAQTLHMLCANLSGFAICVVPHTMGRRFARPSSFPVRACVSPCCHFAYGFKGKQ